MFTFLYVFIILMSKDLFNDFDQILNKIKANFVHTYLRIIVYCNELYKFTDTQFCLIGMKNFFNCINKKGDNNK